MLIPCTHKHGVVEKPSTDAVGRSCVLGIRGSGNPGRCCYSGGANQSKVLIIRCADVRMEITECMEWIDRSERRIRVLEQFTQPLTATQLAGRISMTQSQCSHTLSELELCGLIRCLNEPARASRLFGLTALGQLCHRRVRQRNSQALIQHESEHRDWRLYGWVCFRHRAVVIKTLTEPLQPSEIKRRARRNQDSLRMSAGNVRDVIRLFLRRGIVQAVWEKRRAHARYALTDVGLSLRSLLVSAEAAQ